MSKKTICYCDICGQDISGANVKFKFKCYENDYVNYDDFEFKKWSKLDMCDECYRNLLEFISSKRN